MEEYQNKYVAFCDILGFSNFVLTNFDDTISLYKDFKKELGNDLFPSLEISLYSDSILIIGDNLIDVSKALQILLWTALRYNWLIRGGVSYGKHWKEESDNNLFIVSEALVKAVSQEKTIKHPVIVISDEILLGIDYWVHLFANPVFALPIIHFNGLNIINPFSLYWFSSAEMKLHDLKSQYPNHSEKYQYLLDLVEAIKQYKNLVPPAIFDELIIKGIIKKIE